MSLQDIEDCQRLPARPPLAKSRAPPPARPCTGPFAKSHPPKYPHKPAHLQFCPFEGTRASWSCPPPARLRTLQRTSGPKELEVRVTMTTTALHLLLLILHVIFFFFLYLLHLLNFLLLLRSFSSFFSSLISSSYIFTFLTFFFTSITSAAPLMFHTLYSSSTHLFFLTSLSFYFLLLFYCLLPVFIFCSLPFVDSLCFTDYVLRDCLNV